MVDYSCSFLWFRIGGMASFLGDVELFGKKMRKHLHKNLDDGFEHCFYD